MRPRSIASILSVVDPLRAFPGLWVLGVGLAQIPVFTIQRPWSAMAWFVMAVAPVAFVIGGLLARTVLSPRGESAPRPAPSATFALTAPARGRLRVVLALMVVVGYAELAHQFVSAHGIPLLSGNIDATRASQVNGPTVVLTDLLTIATVVSLVVPRRLIAREAWFELALAAVASLGFLLAGGRGTVVVGLVTALLARSFLRGAPPWRIVIPVAAALAAAVVAVFFYRTGQHRGAPFEHELYTSVIPATPLLLRPYLALHAGLAMNFHVFARLTELFPFPLSWGHGAYSLAAFHEIVPGTRQLENVAASTTGPFITSTAAAPYYADLGPAGVVVGMLGFGAFSVAGYDAARRGRSLARVMAGAYVTYLALFGVYSNLYTGHPDWAIVLPGLLVVGRTAALLERHRLTEIPGLLMTDARALARGLAGQARWYASASRRSAATLLRRALARIAPDAPGGAAWLISMARRPRILLLLALAAALVAGGIAAVGLPHTSPLGSPRLPVADRIALPPVFTPGAQVTTDGDLWEDNTSLWVFEAPRAGSVTVHRLLLGGPTIRDLQTRIAAPAGADAAHVRYGVARWSGGTEAAVEMIPHPGGVSVRVLSLDGRSRQQTAGEALLPVVPGAQRDLAIATFEPGNLPDLFVIDHGLARERVAVSLFSGSSAFRRTEGTFRTPLFDLPGPLWTFFAAQGLGRNADLGAVTRDGTAHRPEVHLVSGNVKFQVFRLQDVMAARPLAPFVLIRPGTSLGRPAVDVIDPVHRTLATYPYGAAQHPVPPVVPG